MEFIIGVFVGALLFYIFVDRKKTSGSLIIDMHDPMDEDICKLELYESLDTVYGKKQIMLDVKTRD